MSRSIFGALTLLLALGSSAIAQACSIPNTLTNGTNADATQVMANFNALVSCVNNSPAPPVMAYLTGLTLSTAGSSASFGIAVGVATSDNGTTSMTLSSALSKTTGVWAVGFGNGSLDTGTIANNTWYHVYLIERTDTGVVDVLISLSPSSPALPANYSVKRRIGSMKTNASAQWTAFIQVGDEFIWIAPISELNGYAVPVASTLETFSGVPTGVSVLANMRFQYTNTTANGSVNVSSPLSGAVTPASGVIDILNPIASTYVVGRLSVQTDTLGRYYLSSASSGGTFYSSTLSWVDRRGRDS